MPRQPGDLIGTRAYSKMRRAVLAASGWRCAACGETGTEKLQLDHIRPRSLQGDPGALDNLQVLCGVCNQIKGGSMMSLDEFRAVRQSGRRPPPPPTVVGAAVQWHVHREYGNLRIYRGNGDIREPLPDCEAAGCPG